MERTNEMNDLHACSLYQVNGIVCDLIDWTNRYPSVEDVRGNCNFSSLGDEVTDAEIMQIISNIRAIDERDFLARHNSLRENNPNYFGFRTWGENRLLFITNDDLCRKLADRLLN